VMAWPATSTAATTARAMVAATHALHVHTGVVVLSRCGQTGGVLGRPCMRAPRENPSVNLIPSALILARVTPEGWAAPPVRTPATRRFLPSRESSVPSG
jgi:hypothetical protein